MRSPTQPVMQGAPQQCHAKLAARALQRRTGSTLRLLTAAGPRTASPHHAACASVCCSAWTACSRPLLPMRSQQLCSSGTPAATGPGSLWLLARFTTLQPTSSEPLTRSQSPVQSMRQVYSQEESTRPEDSTAEQVLDPPHVYLYAHKQETSPVTSFSATFVQALV